MTQISPFKAERPSAVLAALASMLFAAAASAAPTSPIGGCPQPPNALVITEFLTGDAMLARWVEVHNPGSYAISMDNVLLLTAENGKPAGAPVDLGALLPELPAGESIAVGHVADGSGSVWLKLKVVDVGPTMNVPLCKGKLQLQGPNGILDAVSYDLCPNGAPSSPKQALWGVDPSFANICKNDSLLTWCPAADDSYGTPGKINSACDLDGDGFTSTGGDCDDQQKGIHPGSVELCNGYDDDCNGQTDEDLVVPPGTCVTLGVCAGPLENGSAVAKCKGKSGFKCDHPKSYESGNETLCDGFDNDCDGLTDEGLLNACGQCGTAPVELCNGKDDNCNGTTDEYAVNIQVECGKLGVCAQATAICLAGGVAGCAYGLSYEVTETLCDNLDNDCDGMTDEDLGLGAACVSGIGVCSGAGVKQCSGGKVICSVTGAASQTSTELCGDGLDNDCDGSTDEGFEKVGSQCSPGKGICHVEGKFVCSADRATTVCNVKVPPADAVESCGNGLDDNCDGQTDEVGCTSAGDSSLLGGCSNTGGGRANGWLVLAFGVGVVAMRRRMV